jgi:hypothetical protein
VLSLCRILIGGVSALAAFLTVSQASAEPNKEQYELRERCGKRAAEFFNQLGYRDASFENHYNPDLNSCFLLVTITRSETGKGVAWVEWQLWDVNENKELDMLGYRPGPQAFVPGPRRAPAWLGISQTAVVASALGQRCGATWSAKRYWPAIMNP